MARPKNNTNSDILQYALTHLERERDEILRKIAHVTHQLGNKISSYTSGPAKPVKAEAAEGAPRKKRVLSAAARKRIAAAQKKRWDAHRKAKAQ